MSLIRVTEDGIEVDGIILKDNIDIRTFIDSHQPQDVSIGLKIHQPELLTVLLNTIYHSSVSAITDFITTVSIEQPINLTIYQSIVQPTSFNVSVTLTKPNNLYLLFGVSRPSSIIVRIKSTYPVRLDVLVHIYKKHDLTALINSHTFGELTAYINSHPPADYFLYLNLHLPNRLLVGMLPVPYHKFVVAVQPFHVQDILVTVASHWYNLLSIYLSFNQPLELVTYINPMYVRSFKVWFFTVEVGSIDYKVYLSVIKSTYLNLDIALHGWDLHNFTVPIKLSNPYSYTVPMWVWTPLDVITYINIVLPNAIGVDFTVLPEDGVDLRIIHGFMEMKSLSVVLSTWRTFYSLPTYIWGVYTSDHLVDFSMGGSLRLEVPLPGTSGYELLYITLKPSSRIMTTIIPIYTMELLDLYVSINQGWPCGFGSSYKLLTIEFGYAYLKALVIDFKVISGSGTPELKTYINKTYFDTYRQSQSFTMYVPEDVGLEEVLVVDSIPVKASSDFSKIKIGSIRVRFSWPRLKIDVGAVTLSVIINPYPILTLPLDLVVSLWANRPDPPTQPGSRPLIMRESALDEPVWPQVFQVHEIELWGDDPPGVVRKIEIMFDTQVNIYYWVSSEQRAYAKEMWEQWAFLTRGYLPDAQYSGQILYSTVHTLSTMVRYDTIDQAIRAMIVNFAYKDKSTLNVYLKGTGALSRLSVYLDIRDFGRMSRLPVMIEPMHPYNLEINININ